MSLRNGLNVVREEVLMCAVCLLLHLKCIDTYKGILAFEAHWTIKSTILGMLLTRQCRIEFGFIDIFGETLSGTR